MAAPLEPEGAPSFRGRNSNRDLNRKSYLNCSPSRSLDTKCSRTNPNRDCNRITSAMLACNGNRVLNYQFIVAMLLILPQAPT